MAPPTKSGAASKTKIITLTLSKERLVKFPHEPSSPAEPSSPTSSNAGSTAQPIAGVSTPDTAAGATANGGESTPNRFGTGDEKPTLKRNASQMTVDGALKARGKPGPKKKMKVDGPNGTLIPVNAPKLNPKASAGIINANLRALDRSGAPCRRWKRAPFQVKTFTGAVWLSGSTWEAPAKPKPSVDENGNLIPNGSSGASNATSDVVKPNQNSSAVASEKSQNGDAPLATMASMSSTTPVAA